jgi:hypothetical protein
MHSGSGRGILGLALPQIFAYELRDLNFGIFGGWKFLGFSTILRE